MEKQQPVEVEEGAVFVVDNRPRDELIKTILLVVLIIIFPVSLLLLLL